MQQKLLDWFAVHQRVLPWRFNRTPYRVWISEIMLQQTRVDTVIPYYERWMAAFPTLESLADASEQDVLKLWEGLGYYSRARSLLKTAQVIAGNPDKTFPSDPKNLEKLPGIGHYTAGAIASIAFNQPIAALDGNIRRVYARIFDLDWPVGDRQSESKFWQLAAEQIADQTEPGAYHEALMDLGAVICLPDNPQCARCPITEDCLALQHGTTAARPVVLPKPVIPHYQVTAAVIQDGNKKVLLAQRPEKGLLASLWEFPGGKQENGESLEECLEREIQEELAVQVIIRAPFGTYRHAYTHFKVTLHAFLCEIGAQIPQARAAQALEWVEISALADYPMGKIDRQIAKRIQEEINGKNPDELS